MRYIIEDIQPFPGHLETMVDDDGIVGYDGQMLEDYLASSGKKLRVIDERECNALFAAHYLSLITEPAMIEPEVWDDALNVLPPCKWHDLTDRINVFHVSERLCGQLVQWYVKVGFREKAKYYTFTDNAHINDYLLREKIEKAIR